MSVNKILLLKNTERMLEQSEKMATNISIPYNFNLRRRSEDVYVLALKAKY